MPCSNWVFPSSNQGHPGKGLVSFFPHPISFWLLSWQKDERVQLFSLPKAQGNRNKSNRFFVLWILSTVQDSLFHFYISFWASHWILFLREDGLEEELHINCCTTSQIDHCQWRKGHLCPWCEHFLLGPSSASSIDVPFGPSFDLGVFFQILFHCPLQSSGVVSLHPAVFSSSFCCFPIWLINVESVIPSSPKLFYPN